MSFIEKLCNFFAPKECEMFKRLEKLFYYVELCDLSKLDKIQAQDVVCDGLAETCDLYFHSNLGQVHITVIKQFNNVYKLSYANYAGTTVFEITAGQFWVDVKPMLGEHLKAKDVDLAIYELEQYLFNNLGDADDLVKKHNDLSNQRKKLHEEQIKLLENV